MTKMASQYAIRTRTSAPRVVKFTILEDPIKLIITLYTSFVWSMLSFREKKLRHNSISHFDLYGNALANNTCTGGHEIYNLDRPSLAHHYFIYFTWLIYMLSLEKIF